VCGFLSGTKSGGERVLSEVTFEEIADLVRAEIQRGSESEKQEGRRRLLGIVEALAAEQAGALTSERSWIGRGGSPLSGSRASAASPVSSRPQ